MSVDLAIFQTTTNGQATQELADVSGGTTVTAEPKLVQRFILELMTEKGSMTYLPARGSVFVSYLQYGVASNWDVRSAFALAMLDVTSNLTGEESTTDPPSERFAGATLNQILLDGEQVSLDITVVSLAGDTNKVFLPVTFNL